MRRADEFRKNADECRAQAMAREAAEFDAPDGR
jgi:hypothetical protein